MEGAERKGVVWPDGKHYRISSEDVERVEVKPVLARGD